MVLLRKWKLSRTVEGSAKGKFWSGEDAKVYSTGGLFWLFASVLNVKKEILLQIIFYI